MELYACNIPPMGWIILGGISIGIYLLEKYRKTLPYKEGEDDM